MLTGEKQLSVLVKAVFWFVVANALGGALVLILFPAQTERFFFWKITPPINAMLMGAMYLIAGSAVVYAILRGTWESMRFMAVMAATFTTLLFLVTFLHFDRFIPGVRLYYWLVVYLVAAVFAMTIYWRYERAGASWQVMRQGIKPLTRLSGAATGIGITIVMAIGLFAPNVFADVWPWTISPLMMRVFMSWLAALAAGTLWFWVEKDWTRVQPVAYMLMAVPVFLFLLMLINRADLTGNMITLWVFSVLLVLLGLTGVFMVWQQQVPARVRNQNLTVG